MAGALMCAAESVLKKEIDHSMNLKTGWLKDDWKVFGELFLIFRKKTVNLPQAGDDISNY
jgi:hypothetical protein